MDDIVPELIWIALLLKRCEVKRGVELATGVARAAATADPSANKAFAALSDYSELTGAQKKSIVDDLPPDIADTLGSALEPLARHFSAFPLAFVSRTKKEAIPGTDSDVEEIKDLIRELTDRYSYIATFTQSTAVYINFVNNRLKVAQGTILADFPEIERYPATERSLLLAASIRAAVNGLFAEYSPKWANSFWNQGRMLERCEGL